MTLSLDQFKSALVECGLSSSDELQSIVDALAPDKRPADAQALAQLLVQRGTLTRFQAQHIYQGKSKALLFGEYLVLDKIGAGGMGQVYKAQHRRMERVVALKVLPPAATKSLDSVKRFHREVKAAAKLTHPNIVMAHDAGEANGQHFLVMEYVEGGDLAALVKTAGPLTLDEAVNYTLQAARGLEHAHLKNIVHRDVKPSNLLLDTEGTVKILDMGLARIDNPLSADGGDGLTSTGNIMGTVDFMSPEQALDTKHADARSDIYSLGCTMYYMLTANKIYDGDTMMKKLLAHRETPIPPLVSVRPDVPPLVDQVYQKMVAKKPDERYQTMREVVVALEECLSGSLSSTHVGRRTGVPLPPSDSGPSVEDMTQALGHQQLKSIGLPDDTLDRMTEDRTLHAKRKEKPAKAAKAPQAKQAGGAPPRKGRGKLVAAGAAGFVLILLGVIIVLKDRFGRPVGQVEVPDGGSFEVKTAPLDSTPAATVTKPAPSPGATAGLPAGVPPASTSGWHLAFDGKSSYVRVPKWKYTGATPLTVEAWVKIDRPPPVDEHAVVLANTNAESGFAIIVPQHQGGTVGSSFTVYEGANYVAARAKSAMPLNRPVHLAGVFTGKEMRFYVDGKLQARNPVSSFKPSNAPLVIGANAQGQSRFFAGAIDEVRISKVARYDQDFTPAARLKTDANTEILYHLDGDGDPLIGKGMAKDSSGQGYDGEVVSAKWVRGDLVPGVNLPGATGGLSASASPAQTTGPTAAPPSADLPFDAKQAAAHQWAWARYLGLPVEQANSLGIKLTLIPPGKFLMGATKSETEIQLKGKNPEKDKRAFNAAKAETQHQVTLTHPFLLAETETTVGQFRRFVEATGYVSDAEQVERAEAALPADKRDPAAKINWKNPGYKQADDFPVICSWNDAAAFCNWLNQQEGLPPAYAAAETGKAHEWTIVAGPGYRLPTDAQWEFACRAGTTTRYFWGDDPKEGDTYGWSKTNAPDGPQPVGTKLANAFRLFDIQGNAKEWTQDRYDLTTVSSDARIDPQGPTSGLGRTSRGSHWKGTIAIGRSAAVGGLPPNALSPNLCGFRLSRTLEAAPAGALPKIVVPEIHTARELAEWVIGLGGKVTIGGARKATRVEDLPAEFEEITSVSLEALKALDDEVIAKLVTCPRLPSNLVLRGTSITDAGLRMLGSRFPNFSHLNVAGTRISGVGFDAFKGKTMGNALHIAECPLSAAGLQRIGEIGPIRAILDVSRSQVNDAGLAQLARHTELASQLLVNGNPITDAGLASLEGMKSLAELELFSTKVTAAGVAKLQKALPKCKIEWGASPTAAAGAAPKLVVPEIHTARELAEWVIGVGGRVTVGEAVRVGNVKDLPATFEAVAAVSFIDVKGIDDAMVAKMVTLPTLPNNLNLSGTSVTDVGLRALCSRFKSFSYLSFAHTAITGEGFDHFLGKTVGSALHVDGCPLSLVGLARIGDIGKIAKSIHAPGAGVNDEGLKHLARHVELRESLDVSDNPITDAGLASLEGMKSLESLDLRGTKVTAGGVAKLQKALPKCKIEWASSARSKIVVPELRTARELAEWVIGIGGVVRVEEATPIESVKSLPAKFDSLESIGLPYIKQVDDAVVARVVTCPVLPPHLNLDGTAITDAGLRTIGGRFKTFRYLNVANTAITGEGFDAFQGKPFGHSLHVGGCRLSTAGLARIGEIGPIHSSLFAQHADVTDQGLAHLARHSEMQQILDVSDNPITDAGLAGLAGMKSLKTLDLRGTKVTAAGVAKLKTALPNCKIEWNVVGKPITTYNDPAFQAWMKTVAALPAEKQVEVVARKLMDLNPGFDGKVTPTIENGVVTGLKFLADDVTDLSPVRALPGLKLLECSGRDGRQEKGKLSDLSPLARMKLTRLGIARTSVSDLSSLEGMPLVGLYFATTNVRDLSPLGKMKLTTLHCAYTQVSDLSPLAGMKLTLLNCSHTQVSDLTPLAGVTTLDRLDVQDTPVSAAGVAALQKALPKCKIEWESSTGGASAKP